MTADGGTAVLGERSGLGCASPLLGRQVLMNGAQSTHAVARVLLLRLL